MAGKKIALVWRLGMAGLVAGLLLAACSSPSAAQQVCNDRAQLKSAVSAVTSDVRSGNFGKAKDDLTAVSSAFDSLQKSVQQLTSEQSATLSPQIDKLKSTVTSLKDSSSLSDLLSGISSALTQVESISKEIGDTLRCS